MEENTDEKWSSTHPQQNIEIVKKNNDYYTIIKILLEVKCSGKSCITLRKKTTSNVSTSISID